MIAERQSEVKQLFTCGGGQPAAPEWRKRRGKPAAQPDSRVVDLDVGRGQERVQVGPHEPIRTGTRDGAAVTADIDFGRRGFARTAL
ncbi:hypothetical protein ACIQMJ_08495 [Actinosynnema sp. NPDC091369]